MSKISLHGIQMDPVHLPMWRLKKDVMAKQNDRIGRIHKGKKQEEFDAAQEQDEFDPKTRRSVGMKVAVAEKERGKKSGSLK